MSDRLTAVCRQVWPPDPPPHGLTPAQPGWLSSAREGAADAAAVQPTQSISIPGGFPRRLASDRFGDRFTLLAVGRDPPMRRTHAIGAASQVYSRPTLAP
jgi:hypothetical protein